jgi:hypothetical protein
MLVSIVVSLSALEVERSSQEDPAIRHKLREPDALGRHPEAVILKAKTRVKEVLDFETEDSAAPWKAISHGRIHQDRAFVAFRELGTIDIL